MNIVNIISFLLRFIWSVFAFFFDHSDLKSLWDGRHYALLFSSFLFVIGWFSGKTGVNASGKWVFSTG